MKHIGKYKKQTTDEYFYIVPAKLAEAGKPAKAILYGMIKSLSKNNGYCSMGNQKLADKLKVHKDTVSGYITELVEEGYLSRKIYPDNTRQLWTLKGKIVKVGRSQDLDPSVPTPSTLGPSAYHPRSQDRHTSRSTNKSTKGKNLKISNKKSGMINVGGVWRKEVDTC